MIISLYLLMAQGMIKTLLVLLYKKKKQVVKLRLPDMASIFTAELTPSNYHWFLLKTQINIIFLFVLDLPSDN